MMKGEGMKTDPRSLVLQGYVWLMMPALLFLLFWFRWEVALPVAGLLVWSFVRLCRPAAREELPDGGYSAVSASRKRLWLMAAAVIAYVLVCGIGGFVAQLPNDHAWRNGVFFDLARRDWPVAYVGDGAPMLCYYFAFWLPSAVVSKATGLIAAGDAAQVLYAVWGTWIALGFIFSMSGGRMLWRVLLVFIGFNAMDVVTAFFFSDESFSVFEDPWAAQLMWLSTTSGRFAASANPVIYNFIYNQGIAVWVFMSLLMQGRRDTGRLLLLFGMLPAFAPIPSLAVAPWVAWRLLRGFRQTLTVENVAGLLFALLTTFFMLQNNSGSALRRAYPDTPVAEALLLAAAYYALSFGAFVIFIWRYVRRDGLYWSLVAMCVAVSLVGVGKTPDLAWRISLPAVVMTAALVCRRAAETAAMSRGVRCAFVAVLLVGSFSSVWSVVFTLHEEACVWRGERERKYLSMLGRIADPSQPYYNNFVATGDSFYRRHLAPPDIRSRE